MSIIGNSRLELDMTQGSIIKHLITFSIPLLLGNLFQQFYNMVDTWVVGKFVSDDAFSAVGTLSPILNLFIFAFMGFAQGGAVMVSQYFGAGDKENVSKTVHTMFVIALAFCIVFTLLGYVLVPTMVSFIKSPEGVKEEQIEYLRIIFAFLSFQILYNMTSAILRAVGDSTRPFMFLVVACVVNIVLDLLFVIKFNMGVAGVAWATIIAQGISSVLCIYVLLTTGSSVRLTFSKIKYHVNIATMIFRLGFPTALQTAITSFSNIFVQGYINDFGADVMGGWTCYIKTDQFVMLPQQSIGMAITTFIGQNLGAGDERRAKKGLTSGVLLCCGVTAVLVVFVEIFASQVCTFFTDSETFIKYGVFFLRFITPFMLISCPAMMLISSLRGAGNSKAPMIITLFSYVIFRQIYLFVVSRLMPGELIPVSFAYPAGWLLCFIMVLIYYVKVGFGVRGSIADAKQ